jgi:hypothetical protein
MDNFDLKNYLSENKSSQFRSKSSEKLLKAKANFSNSITELDSKDPDTKKKAKDEYVELGKALDAHLKERFNK